MTQKAEAPPKPSKGNKQVRNRKNGGGSGTVFLKYFQHCMAKVQDVEDQSNYSNNNYAWKG